MGYKLINVIDKLNNFKEHKFKEKLKGGLGELYSSGPSGGNTNFHLYFNDKPGHIICYVSKDKKSTDKLNVKQRDSKATKVIDNNYKKLIEYLKKTEEFKEKKEIKKCIQGNYNDCKFSIENEEELEVFIDAVRKVVGLEPIYTKKETIKEIREKAIDALEIKKQIILSGPPGTGKTWMAKELAVDLINGKLDEENNEDNEEKNIDEDKFKSLVQDKRIKIVQFHPSYNYEDFVRGIEVSTTDAGNTKYKTVDKIFGEIAKEANTVKRATEEAKKINKDAEPKDADKYVLIIDEINRAPITSVLGELFYALEYRGQEISTPYKVKKEDNSKKEDNTLDVPDNLYIIGTMNTADRTIGTIDYALRRRFAFVDVPSIKLELEEDNKYFAEKVFDEIDKFFKSESLSKGIKADDIKIGTSYFICKKENGKLEKEHLKYKIKYEILPILEEYYKDGLFRRKGKVEINNEPYEFKELFYEKSKKEEFIDILVELEGESDEQ